MVIRSTNVINSVKAFRKKHNKEILNKKDLKKLSNLLLKNENEYNPDYLKSFQLSETELLKGVICPECSSIPLS